MPPVTQDILISVLCVLLAAAPVAAIFNMLRDRVRRSQLSSLWKRRDARLSTYVVSIYLIFFILASIELPQWRSEGSSKIYLGGKPLLAYILGSEREESYSAPCASKSLDGKTQLKGFHLLGTNIGGEDVLLEGLKSIKTALLIGILTTLVAVPLGALFGMMAGYFGKWVDTTITYIYSTLAAVPEILLLIVLMNVFGRGIGWLCLALGITSWVGLCRLVRAETLKIKNLEYVQAAQILGVSSWKILLKHILPNLTHILLITSVLRFSGLIMNEAVLSYLGIGVGAGTSSWGVMIDQARQELSRDPAVWWNIACAFILSFILILAVNVLGDALRDAFDPRSRRGN